ERHESQSRTVSAAATLRICVSRGSCYHAVSPCNGLAVRLLCAPVGNSENPNQNARFSYMANGQHGTQKGKQTKFILVTGGVVSSLGKGLASASIGALLENRGVRVTIQKLDPYINVAPGTMNPLQHGEVCVTGDGAEADLDLGHHERSVTPRRPR